MRFKQIRSFDFNLLNNCFLSRKNNYDNHLVLLIALSINCTKYCTSRISKWTTFWKKVEKLYDFVKKHHFFRI